MKMSLTNIQTHTLCRKQTTETNSARSLRTDSSLFQTSKEEKQ